MAGYSGFSDLLDVIVTGCVYRFVKKPLDAFEIKQAVEAAITQYNTKNW